MRLFLAIAILCLPLRMIAAPGDVLWLAVGTNGWDCYLAVQGMNTNGTYDLSPTTNNRLSLVVRTMAFDDFGNGTTTTREILGTYRVRKPVPNEALADEQIIDTTNAVLRISLSDTIYSRDSNIVVTVKSGLYAAGGVTNAAASSITVTNLSTLAYPATVANWSWPGFQRITNTTHTLRVVAFNKFAQSGRPVRAVEFSATDGTTSVTNLVTQPAIDPTTGDVIPTAEYIGRLTVPAAWVNGAIITNHFRAIPWAGDAVLSTYDGVHSEPGVFWRPQRSINDVSNLFGVTIAIVATNGVSGGIASTNALDTNSPPTAFATVNQAAAAIAATNNLIYGRNSTAAGIIYVQHGEHLWTGGSSGVGSPNQTWIEVTSWPHHAPENVVFTNSSGSVGIAGMVKLSRVRLAGSAATQISNATNVWLHQCIISSSASALVYQRTHWSVTGCTITNMTQGLQPFSTENSPPVLVRGNRVLVPVTVQSYTVLGNTFLGNTVLRDFYSGATVPPSTNIILFNNRSMLGGANSMVNLGVATNYNGAAIVQNELEFTNSGSVTLLALYADSNVTPGHNILLWGNTWAGQRINWNYNDTGSAAVDRSGWSLQGNLGDDSNIKTDNFATTNANRVGNWAGVWGAGNRANHFAQVTGIGATGFWGEYPGLYSIERDGASADYVRFQARRSYDGSSVGTGFGDYRLRSDSPLFRIPTPVLISHDMDGIPRGLIDPPGARASGNVLKGAFF